jgi:hypothetical protein
MALKKTFENQDGSTSSGYYRVREVHTQYEKEKGYPMDLAATFDVEVYYYDTGERVTYSHMPEKPPWKPEGIGVYVLTIPDLEPVQNLIIRAYDHLKTLPEFSEATDC